MRTSQSSRATLGEADVVELALVDEDYKRLDRVFDGHIRVDSRRLEQVQLLRATKGRVDVVHAPAEILLRRVWAEALEAALSMRAG